MEATYRYGPAQPIPHTAGADIAAGQVLIVGETLRIAHSPIDNGEFGTLYCGGGVYEVTPAANIAIGIHVYWDNSAKKVTATGGANLYFGIAVEALVQDVVGNVQHLPAPPDTVGGS